MYKTKLKTSLLGPPGWITDEDISEIEAAQER